MSGQELFNTGFNLFVLLLIWAWYRNRRCSPALKYFTFWPRFWTGLVDSCVLWPLGFVLGLLLRRYSSPMLGVGWGFVSNILGVMYTVWLHARYGQTVGKMVCKVRVVDHLTETSITWRQAIVRECIPMFANLGVLGYFFYLIGSGALNGETWKHPERVINIPLFTVLNAVPLLWFLVEIVTMFSNDKRRALHDIIAGTVVVRTNLDGAATVAPEPSLSPAV